MSRRGPGEGSITLRKDGRWQVRVDLGRDELGVRRRKYLYAETQAEAVELLHRAQRDRRAGRLIAARWDAPRTLGDWLDRWLETVRATREPGTHQKYESDVRLHIKPALGRIRLTRLTPHQVESFLLAKLKSGAAPATVAKIQAVLSSALARAVRMDLIPRNVASGEFLELPRTAPRVQQAMSLKEAKAFIAAVRNDRLYALFLTAVVLGQRQSEMLGLRWCDVDFDGGRLRITYRLVRVEGTWQLRAPGSTKGARKTLPLLAPVASALREHQIRQKWERDIAGADWQVMETDDGAADLVFTSAKGAPLHPGQVREAFQRRLRDANLPRLRFHDLRHSAASIMLALGIPLKTVSSVLGHSSIRMTADVYGHLTEAVLRDQLASLDAAWADEALHDVKKKGL